MMHASKLFRATQALGRHRNVRRNVSLASLASTAVINGLHCNYSFSDSSFAHHEKYAAVPCIRIAPKAPSSRWGNLCRLLRWLQKKIETLFSLVSRSLYLMLCFGPAAVTVPLLLLDSEGCRQWWWAVLRNCVRRSGPCSTKFAQWIATRPDLFPLSLCKNLEDLQSNTLTHRWSDTQRALTLAFGDDWGQALRIEGEGAMGSANFSPVVLGSGCVAQVLKGSLKVQGEGALDRQVAVKIIHPGEWSGGGRRLIRSRVTKTVADKDIRD